MMAYSDMWTNVRHFWCHVLGDDAFDIETIPESEFIERFSEFFPETQENALDIIQATFRFGKYNDKSVNVQKLFGSGYKNPVRRLGQFRLIPLFATNLSDLQLKKYSDYIEDFYYKHSVSYGLKSCFYHKDPINDLGFQDCLKLALNQPQKLNKNKIELSFDYDNNSYKYLFSFGEYNELCDIFGLPHFNKEDRYISEEKLKSMIEILERRGYTVSKP